MELLQKVENRFEWMRSVVKVGLPLAAVLIFVSVLPELEKREHWGPLFTYTLLTIICSFSVIRTFNFKLTLNNAVFFSGILLYGASIAAWSVVLEVLILAFLTRMPLLKVLANAGQMLLTVWLVATLQSYLNSFSLPWMLTDILLIIVYWLANTFLCAIGIASFNKVSWMTIAKVMIKDFALSYLMVMSLGELGARLVEIHGILALLPVTIAFGVISAVFYKYATGVNKLEQKMEEIRVLNESFLAAMAAAIDARDPYTHGHSSRVAFWARELASALGLPNKQVEEVYYGGILHDIGKIGIEDAILNKTGKLTHEEYDKIKQHPVIGYQIVERAGVFPELLPAIRSHHERIDGKGYPDGLQGDQIPLIARILAISDAFDAMVSDRPYRKGMPVETALQQIKEGAGTQFDEEFAAAFVKLVSSRSTEELEALNRRGSNDSNK
ncbi:HD-GYP domain-containing protein [Effusibacillus consociatus]|uniref:HD-GYP domain-containing protein n=1 Tax=Effusibacillus consociatus TaxID=1117041 RepID=A0ABV9QA31_9BACL